MTHRTTPPSHHQPIATFSVDALTVRLYNSQTALAQDAAIIAQTYLQTVLNRRGTVAVLLATGNSQRQFLDQLTNRGGVDWSRITCLHLDEYLGISADHPASFRRYLRERVETRVIPRQFHYIIGDTLQPLGECDRYTRLLQAHPIDLCCLGVGENGHLAFNDPAVADFEDPLQVKLVKLDLNNRLQQANEGHFPTLEEIPAYAFTLTIPALCAAQKILCLAPEKRKAQVVKQMLEGPISTTCPASVLRTQANATLLIDTDAASLLDNIPTKIDYV